MINFKKPSEFPKGTLYNQLVDAYSFNDEYKKKHGILHGKNMMTISMII